MLRLQNITIRYGDKTILKDFSLSVDKGEIVCLCGESGCGKTSLLNAVMGFVDCEGSISFDGVGMTAANIDEIRRQIAYVPQELALPQETVSEMVRLPFMLKANRAVAFSEEMITEEWSHLNLEPSLLQMGTGQISGGQRQRIMLSVAGLLQKPLMIVDEPTSALDADSARLVLDYFRFLARERGMAILLASHHAEIINGCDRREEMRRQ